MNKTVCSGDITSSDMPIIAVAVTVSGEDIPKILRERRECLAEYKGILRKSSSTANLKGRCVPVYDRDEKCYALMFTRGENVDAERKAIEQLNYFADVTACGVAYRSCDFDSNVIAGGLNCSTEEWR